MSRLPARGGEIDETRRAILIRGNNGSGKIVRIVTYQPIALEIQPQRQCAADALQHGQRQGEARAKIFIKRKIFTGILGGDDKQWRLAYDGRRSDLNAGVHSGTAGIKSQVRPARRRRQNKFMRDFVVAKTARLVIQLLLHGTVITDRQAIIGAIVGDQWSIEGSGLIIVAGFELLEGKTVLQPDLMFEVPKIVVLGVKICAQLRRARCGLIVHLHPRMPWQSVF